MQTVLITGATGFLGRYLTAGYRSAGFHVITLGRSDLSGDHIQADLSKSPPSISSPIDIVVHAAGAAHVSEGKPQVATWLEHTNVEGTRHLLQALEVLPKAPHQFVFISTVAVYGLNTGDDISEDRVATPTTTYGKSKLVAEGLVSEWCEERGVLNLTCRLPLIAGHDAPGSLATMRSAMAKRIYVRVGSGKAKRSIVSAADLALFLPTAVDGKGTFNLGSQSHPRVIDIESAVLGQVGRAGGWVFSIPETLAAMIGGVGSLINRCISFPITRDRLKKLTASLTFSSENARREIGWNPSELQDDPVAFFRPPLETSEPTQ